MPANQMEELMALVRSQRHSYMNHLQVISGWLQLNRVDRAQQYLQALADRLSVESEAVRRLPGDVALALLSLTVEAESHGSNLSWKVEGDFQPLSGEQLAELIGVVRTAFAASEHLPESSRTVRVALGPGARFAVHSPPPAGEG